MIRPAVIVLLSIAAITIAAIAAAARPDEGDQRPRPATTSPRREVGEPAATPAPPTISPRQLDRQDRVNHARRRTESTADDRRPLLTQLPLTRAGITIDLVGLHRNGRQALLTVRHPHRTRRDAHVVYRRALQAAGDTGRAYRVRYQP
jgi:hypothetical protein